MPSPSFSSSLSSRALPVISGRPKLPEHIRAEENSRLVLLTMRRRFAFLFRDPDSASEAYTAGYVELVGAARRFDPESEYAFSTYACRCVEGGILKWLRRERLQNQLPVVSLETPIGEGGGELADMIADPQAVKPEGALVASSGFEQWLQDLSPRQADILRALYWEEKDLGEIASAMGITRQRVHQLEKQAIRSIRKAMVQREAAARIAAKYAAARQESDRRLTRFC